MDHLAATDIQVYLTCFVRLFLAALIVTGLSLATLMLLKRSERWLSRDSFRVINIRSVDSVEIYEMIEQFFTSRNLQIIGCGFENETASADFDDRFVGARFGVDSQGMALMAIQQIAGIRQVRNI